LEEERIGAMYVSLWKRWITELWGRMFPRGLLRSPLLPAGVLAALIIGPAIAWHLHRKGQFHRVKGKIHREIGDAGTGYGTRPGGLDPIMLTRTQTPGSNGPEFLSATILPGMGMSVLQITAYLPDRGATPLLAAPSVEAMAQGSMGPPTGVNDSNGVIEVPWGGELTGGVTPVGTTVSVNWKGRDLEIPTDPGGRPDISDGGLLNGQAVDESHKTPLPEGALAQGIFRGLSFDDHWLSKTDTSVSVQMTAQSIDLTVQTKNTGDQPEPMGIGWHPRFAVVGGARDRVQLRLPNGDRLEIADRIKGLPSGKIEAAGTAVERFQGHPAELGPISFDETLVNLKSTENGPAVEMLDPAAGFGVRMTVSSPSIHAVRVTSPGDATYVSLGMQTNLDDPFGKEWTGTDGSEMVTLNPGQMLEWKVRLEIFPVAKP
jgi:aldose 1-epimerase